MNTHRTSRTRKSCTVSKTTVYGHVPLMCAVLRGCVHVEAAALSSTWSLGGRVRDYLFVAGCVSYMRVMTTAPEVAVSAATA